jgi:hypothetical protein
MGSMTEDGDGVLLEDFADLGLGGGGHGGRGRGARAEEAEEEGNLGGLVW